MPDGTQMTIRGLANLRGPCTRRMKYASIFSQMSKLAMTPSRRGRMAWMWLGVRPIIRLASAPTASGRSVLDVDGDDGRLVEHDAAATHVHQGVGRAEVDGHVPAEK